MKIRFNKFERVAGVFVGLAIVGSVTVAGGVAVKKGWFALKVKYHTFMKNADGIHPGTLVQIQGLRAGSVDDVELMSANEVKITFSVFEKFADKIRKDSHVQVVRPFIIGERVLEIGVGSKEEKKLPPRAELKTIPSFDVMELLSGKKMAPFLGVLDKLASNMQVLAEAFADPKRTEALVKVFDKMNPLMGNLNTMSKEVITLTGSMNKHKRADKIFRNLASITQELNKVLPQVNKESPQLGTQLGQMVTNLNQLTQELQKLTPTINAVAPKLPNASLRAVEALNEVVITLKAMQKSFFLRGNVEDVKEEEAAARKPASED